MAQNKELNYLGLAKRSGNLIVGTEGVVKSLPLKKITLIVIANDASPSTKDKIIKKAFYYNIVVVDKYSSNEISAALGANNLMVVAFTNQGLSNAFKEEIKRGVV